MWTGDVVGFLYMSSIHIGSSPMERCSGENWKQNTAFSTCAVVYEARVAGSTRKPGGCALLSNVKS